ncbi:MAG: hypothetical protein GC162_10235 [Planctomycetes bacterium]|nr:hypothetical protein [Planctomycetota bacterium]
MSETKSAGLPMTAKWDPQKLEAESAALIELERKPFMERVRGYYKLTGPAWMQSAMTLGAGSAAASVVAGAFYGYQLLWVQPIAMILGVAMMSALANITLTKGERGYLIVKRELHVSIALLWAITTVVSTVIWHMGQYALLGGASWDLANVAGVTNAEGSQTAETIVRFAGGLIILAINIMLTWSYGSKPTGIKLYESFIRWMVRMVMLAFLIVVAVQTVKGRIAWGALFKGFFVPSIPDQPGSMTTVLGAIGAAVGINMTFLYPYSILAKGWGKHHKGLAQFDLCTSLFIPYTILTSLIIIGMASTIHQPPYGVIDAMGTNVTPATLKPVQAAASLRDVLGGPIGRIVFDLGFIGMCCGAISAHMVCCGFTICEMFGLEYTPKRYRMFTLVPAVVGIWGVMIPSPIWLPVLASAIAFAMLPIAYVSFFILQNKRSYLGDAVGKGGKRIAFNIVLLIAVIMSVVGSAIKIKGGVIDKIASWMEPAPAVTAPAVPPPPSVETTKP